MGGVCRIIPDAYNSKKREMDLDISVPENQVAFECGIKKMIKSSVVLSITQGQV